MVSSLWWDIPDTAINKEFFSDTVCKCKNYRPADHWLDPIGFYENIKRCREGNPHFLKMKCGGYNAALGICDGCDSVFYTAFPHPRQVYKWEPAPTTYRSNIGHVTRNGTGRRMYCWYCLEAGLNIEPDHWWYMGYIAVPPPPELLHPYVKPVTALDKALKVSSKLDELDEMLRELEGVILEHRQPQ